MHASRPPGAERGLGKTNAESHLSLLSNTYIVKYFQTHALLSKPILDESTFVKSGCFAPSFASTPLKHPSAETPALLLILSPIYIAIRLKAIASRSCSRLASSRMLPMATPIHTEVKAPKRTFQGHKPMALKTIAKKPTSKQGDSKNARHQTPMACWRRSFLAAKTKLGPLDRDIF